MFKWVKLDLCANLVLRFLVVCLNVGDFVQCGGVQLAPEWELLWPKSPSRSIPCPFQSVQRRPPMTMNPSKQNLLPGDASLWWSSVLLETLQRRKPFLPFSICSSRQVESIFLEYVCFGHLCHQPLSVFACAVREEVDDFGRRRWIMRSIILLANSLLAYGPQNY